ncbi:hypothetical protein FisN_10Lh038 [Fistulifera solaris]|uniref:DUF155 domain-containing protein n=1 Tax=Fistulifera solaris TaxID=1519565 RepID=A0A1Z5JT42_FISSO|nr:hypothetical protein FisN_10Lh038 [Fistulifera solaris]|eukprot:GAX17190.1 hypothetical protein FisN_10Lh038 [Fistulifera solaris]
MTTPPRFAPSSPSPFYFNSDLRRRKARRTKHSPVQQQHHHHHQQQQQQQSSLTSAPADDAVTGQLLPVTARHIAQNIDLFSVLKRVFSGTRAPTKQKVFGNKYFVLEMPTTIPSKPSYVAVFKFGSIVALNVSPRDLDVWIQEIKQMHVKDPALSGFERKENYGILVDASQSAFDVSTAHADDNLVVAEENVVVTGDMCIVPELDVNGVAVIANIMAQTVALDSYNELVDGLLSNFAEINAKVTETGKFTQADKDFLFRSVAQNNSIFIDMISRVRIKDRSDMAWHYAKYEKIHSGMKQEFEIDDRFDHIEFKLNLIQQNAKFFLEVLQHQKSNSLEWIIVALISVECVIMCIDMTGMGEPLFKTLSSII